MKICAYCGNSNRLSIEHIFPRWLVRRTQYDARFSRTENRVSERVFTIRDVCVTCNNGPLSELDAYARKMYERYFDEPIYSGERVKFEYDHDLLTRWVLKILYNSARKNNTEPEELGQFSGYILGNETRPTNVKISAFLIKPFEPPKRVIEKFRSKYGDIPELPPRHVTTQQLGVEVPEEGLLVFGRALFINSYGFVVFSVPQNIPRYIRRYLTKFLKDHFEKRFRGIQEVDPKRGSIWLATSDTDLLQLKQDSLSIFKDAYDDYYERRRRKEAKGGT